MWWRTRVTTFFPAVPERPFAASEICGRSSRRASQRGPRSQLHGARLARPRTAVRRCSQGQMGTGWWWRPGSGQCAARPRRVRQTRFRRPCQSQPTITASRHSPGRSTGGVFGVCARPCTTGRTLDAGGWSTTGAAPAEGWRAGCGRTGSTHGGQNSALGQGSPLCESRRWVRRPKSTVAGCRLGGPPGHPGHRRPRERIDRRGGADQNGHFSCTPPTPSSPVMPQMPPRPRTLQIGQWHALWASRGPASTQLQQSRRRRRRRRRSALA